MTSHPASARTWPRRRARRTTAQPEHFIVRERGPAGCVPVSMRRSSKAGPRSGRRRAAGPQARHRARRSQRQVRGIMSPSPPGPFSAEGEAADERFRAVGERRAGGVGKAGRACPGPRLPWTPASVGRARGAVRRGLTRTASQ